MTGDLVAATADRAPPPLAWPSSLVITTLLTSTWTTTSFPLPNHQQPLQHHMNHQKYPPPHQVIPTFSEKALACASQAAPILASITKMAVSGLMAFDTANISSNSASSCLARPLVSTMMISKPSSLKYSTPSLAITAGSTWENKYINRTYQTRTNKTRASV